MRYSKPIERDAERLLVDGVKSRGGRAFKLKFIGIDGAPDRLLLLPKGRMFLVELKDVGGMLEQSQKVLFPIIEKLGLKVHVLYGEAEVAAFLQEMDRGI